MSNDNEKAANPENLASDEKKVEGKVEEILAELPKEERMVSFRPSFARKQREVYGFSERLGIDAEVIEVDQEAPKGIENMEASTTAKPKKATKGDLDPTFYEVKKVSFAVEPLEPHLRLCSRRYLQLERATDRASLHAGGLDSVVELRGFASREYVKLVGGLLKDRKLTLGVTCVGVKRSEIHRKIAQYYNDFFRGETAVLQVVVNEVGYGSRVD